MLRKTLTILTVLYLVLNINVIANIEISSDENNKPKFPNQMMHNPEASDMDNTRRDVSSTYESSKNQLSTNEQDSNELQQLDRNMPDNTRRFSENMQDNNEQAQKTESMTFLSFVKTYSTPITSVFLLGAAFIFVIFYRKKNY